MPESGASIIVLDRSDDCRRRRTYRLLFEDGRVYDVKDALSEVDAESLAIAYRNAHRMSGEGTVVANAARVVPLR